MTTAKKKFLEQLSRRCEDTEYGIRLQSLSERERADIEGRWYNLYKKDPSKLARTVKVDLLSLCIVDKDGNRLFDDESKDELYDLDSGALDDLYRRARRLCGMEEADEDSEKN